MFETENTTSQLNDFVKLLGKVRCHLDAIYFEEMNRIHEDEVASNKNREEPGFEIV